MPKPVGAEGLIALPGQKTNSAESYPRFYKHAHDASRTTNIFEYELGTAPPQ